MDTGVLPSLMGDLSEISANPWLVLIALVLATFVSEDLTCVAAGLLARNGEIPLSLAVAGCTIGIVLGDFGLWLLGRVAGRRVVQWPWVARWIKPETVERGRQWFDQYGWSAIFVSRFVPGTRFPTYVAAGIVGEKLGRFMFWVLLASLVWTPALVVLSAVFGDAVAGPLERWLGGGMVATLVTLVLLLLLLRVGYLLITRQGRRQLGVEIARLRCWEFWPAWIFYLPLVLRLIWTTCRYRGIRWISAANPGIWASGIVGESKIDILRALPEDAIVPSAMIPAGDPEEQLAAIDRLLAERQWQWPLVFKPNASQRGVGFKVVRSREQARAYVDRGQTDVLVQTYHPGPCEAGIFYVRQPDQGKGQIFSITDKEFPEVVGNGRDSVRELIWGDARYRMQAPLFLKRLGKSADRVPGDGEQVRLGIAGNHCQGTLFKDGQHLWSAALEERIDEISRAFPGFYFGRYDVRYGSAEELRQGKGFAIVELNGALSEATDLYDPKNSLIDAYHRLFRQWELLFEIGHKNALAGAETMSGLAMLGLIVKHYRERDVDVVAD